MSQPNTQRQPVRLPDVSKTLGAFMPLKLKAVMRAHHITRIALAEHVLQRGGKPMSDSAVAQLCNHAIYPKLSDAVEIQTQIVARLRVLGVPEDELAVLFDDDDDERALGADASMRSTHAEKMASRPLEQRGTRARKPVAPRAPRAEELPPEPEILPVEPAMLSPQAKSHFRLFRDPFSDDVQEASDVFTSPDVRYVREAMFTTARLGGFLAVVGESGAGKTVLRRDLIDRVQREGHPIRIIQPRALDKVTLTARHICEAILEDLRPGTRHATSLERLARQVEQLLLDSSRAGNQHLLLIEEAHDLHISTLKYLKRFWELEDGFKKLLAIVLVGQPELKQRLDERINFDAREVIRRCEIAELQPLNNNLETYLAHKLRRVGADPEQILDESAYTAIRNRLTVQRGGGRAQMLSLLYPLVVNNLVTRALNSAADLCAPRVTADVIAEL